MHFPCPACGSTLEVPPEYLGASGPCPHCRQIVNAPTYEALQGSPMPPPRELPPRPEAPAPVLPQKPRSRAERIRDRLRKTRLPRVDASGPSLAQLLGWGSVALVLAAGGFAWAVARYTVPVQPPAPSIVVPPDLTLKVLAEKQRLEIRREETIQRALSAAESLLQKGSAAEPPLGIFALSGTQHHFEAGLFPDLHAGDLEASACVRKPGTEDFFLTIQPADGGGPVLLLEQQAGEFKLHADAFVQQIDDTLADFLENVGEGQLAAYVTARPSHAQFPLEELLPWTKWDLQTPFPNAKPLAFVACAKPDGALAKLLHQHRENSAWIPLVIKLQWSRTSGDQPFIEMLETVPTAWSKF